MKSSAQICFIVLTFMPWCDGSSITLHPVIDAYFPAQIVAVHFTNNFFSCKRGGHFGEKGHNSVFECLCLHDTVNSDLICWTEKVFLFDVIVKSCKIFIIQYMLYLCWSDIFRQMIVWMQDPQLNNTTFFIHWMIGEDWTNIQIMHHTFINATYSIVMVLE